jgi:Pleckstrin homology domain
VLVHGHLMRFNLSSRSTSVLHSRAKTINLLDAYVTSGYFAALELNEGSKAFEPMARRFQDGLETDDADMDTLIIIRCVSVCVCEYWMTLMIRLDIVIWLLIISYRSTRGRLRRERRQ